MSFESDALRVVDALRAYREESLTGSKRVINQTPISELSIHLGLGAFVGDGGLTGDKLDVFLRTYLDHSTRLHHPGYFAHQVAPPEYAGGLATFVDGVINNVTSVYEMGPSAACVEDFVIRWMLDRVGWPSDDPGRGADGDRDGFAGGVLTHGGSLANLTGLVAARTRLCPDVWASGTPGDLALLASADCHYSIARAAGILGIGRDAIYLVEGDGRGAIRPDRLPAVHERLVHDGKRAVALVANACSTAVGIYDPIDEIGDFCRENDVWLHVDGTHGASVLLSDALRKRLKGIEKADSLTWDPHKLLLTPALCAALLVRDRRALDSAFRQDASYIIHEKEQYGVDTVERTIECTKPGLGLKFYLVLASRGESYLAEYVEGRYAITLEAYEYLCGLPDFTCAVRPESNVLCFRTDGSDRLQLDLRDRLMALGRFHVSTTMFKDERYLRIVLMSPSTDMTHIQKLIEDIRALRSEIRENVSDSITYA